MARLRIRIVGLAILGSLACWGSLCAWKGWARSWEDITASGTLRVAVKDNLPPLGFRDPQGEWVGFEIDLAQELGRRILGPSASVELVATLNQDRLNYLWADQVDLVIAQMGMTPARAREVSFSGPYYWDGTGLLVRDPQIQHWRDLQGRPVAIVQGSDALSAARLGIPSTELLPVETLLDARGLLEIGAVEAVGADRSVLAGWMREDPALRIMTSPLSRVGLGVVTAKGIEHARLTQRVAQEIEILRESGWLQERAEMWGLP